jgi:hypothetical protein
MNGEIYLTVSNNGGLSWSRSLDLTDTKTPNCNPAVGDSCVSEHWGSIARIVDDTIHLFYVADRDAGSAPLGEGTWTYNPMMYYRIPGGTDAPYLCPVIAPTLAVQLSDSDPDSGYAAVVGSNVHEMLTLANLGAAPLVGSISVSQITPSAPIWLTVAGAGSYTLAPGDPELEFPVTMATAGVSAGVYQSEIRVAHNDTTQPSPFVIPVTFRVICDCPHQGDVWADGVIDVFDVIEEICYAFVCDLPLQDPGCPITRCDVNNDGVTDVFDVIDLIATAFTGGPNPVNPCVP